MVKLCGIDLAHPIINASGTFDVIAARRAFGDAVIEQFPFAAYVTKTVTVQTRAGNPPPRLWETDGAMINSIGLPNRGLDGFLRHDLPQLTDLSVPLIINVMGFSAEEFAELVKGFGEREEVGALELNVSCPNVKTGLMFGGDPSELGRLLEQLRPLTTKPLIVKMTPNLALPPNLGLPPNLALPPNLHPSSKSRGALGGEWDSCSASATNDALDNLEADPRVQIAQAAANSGADALSAINTVTAAAEHPRNPGRAWLGGVTGGLSGPAIRPRALNYIRALRSAVTLPIVGMGGVQTGQHAYDLLQAGADVVAVGSESFRDPLAGLRVARELAEI